MSKHNSIIVSTVCTLTQVGVRSVLLATVYVGSQYYKIIVVTYDYVDDALWEWYTDVLCMFYVNVFVYLMFYVPYVHKLMSSSAAILLLIQAVL